MFTNNASAMWKPLGVALLVSLSGCAAAYHGYQGPCVPYLYCTPPPLPYVGYDTCHCPTPGASAYYQQRGVPDADVPESAAPVEAPAPSEDAQPPAGPVPNPVPAPD